MSQMRQKFCEIHGLMFHDDCDDHPEFESFTLGYKAATEAAKATSVAVGEIKPMTMSYVQAVPNHCDRITWRGSYYHLKEGAEAARQPAPALPVNEIAKKLNALDMAIAHSTNLTPHSKPRRLLAAIIHEVCSDAALAATAAPVLSDEQISKMARYLSDFSSDQCGVNKDDAWAIYGNDEIELVRAALAATRSQP